MFANHFHGAHLASGLLVDPGRKLSFGIGRISIGSRSDYELTCVHFADDIFEAFAVS